MNLREICERDIPTIFEIRASVRENRISRADLAEIGVTEATVTASLGSHRKGWLVEEAERLVGFSMADSADGSIFALFVDPESEGRGYGSRLHDAAVAWLFSRGFETIALTTDPDTRAHAFYLRRGWVLSRLNGDGEACLTLSR